MPRGKGNQTNGSFAVKFTVVEEACFVTGILLALRECKKKNGKEPMLTVMKFIRGHVCICN